VTSVVLAGDSGNITEIVEIGPTSIVADAPFMTMRKSSPFAMHSPQSNGRARRMRELRGPYLATGAATGVLLPFVAPILASRGFSPQSIGLLLAITSAALVVAAPIWGQLGDVVLGRRRTLQWSVLIAALASLLLGGRLALPLVGAVIATLYVLQTAFSALLDSIAMHALGNERHRYGHLRLMQSSSYAIAAFIAGVIYDRAGYGSASIVFPAAAVALFILLQAVRDPPRTKLRARPVPPATPPGPEYVGAALRAASRSMGAVAAILLASVGLLAANVFLPLRLHDLGTAPSVFALSATASALFEIPVMLLGRQFLGKLGLRGFFALGCLMYLVAVASWIVVDDPKFLVASRVLTGFGYGSFTVSSVVAVGVLLPEELQASGQALRLSAISAVAVVGYFFGGMIYGVLGSAAFFAITACGPALGAILAWRCLPARNVAAPPPPSIGNVREANAR
jgi:PPP family 3-phenylpropionic acid transporter